MKSRLTREIEAHWYAVLKTNGFEDIEDTSNPDRPLREWHSRKFLNESYRARHRETFKYFEQFDEFINNDTLYELCCLVAKHGNSTLWPEDVKDILDLHQDGWTERGIAREINRGKKCVHLTLKKAREWMKIV